MRAKGFTLIELIVVIVILGILAVTAAPKYLGMTNDARNATLKSTMGTLSSAAELAHGKLAIEGLESREYIVSIDEPRIEEWCELCAFRYGYPTTMANTWTHLVSNIGFGDEEFAIGVISGEDNPVFSFNENIKDGILITDNCYIEYTPANKGTEYSLELVECQ